MFASVRRRQARRAIRTAEVLDRVVSEQLQMVPALSEDSRRRAAEHLSELVLLAQAYRHFANGWITRRELDERGLAAASRLTVLRRTPVRQLTEQD